MPCRPTRSARVALLIGGLLAVMGSGVAADVLVPRKGKKVEGAIVKDDASGVVFNIYFSKNPGVTNPDHLVTVAASGVKRLEVKPRPEVEIWRLIKAGSGDAAKLFEAGTYAKTHKLKAEAKMAFALALAADGTHKEALKAIGGNTKWAKAQLGNPDLDPALREQLAAYAKEDDPATRVKLALALKQAGFPAKPPELERYRRSTLQPTGYQNDRPITLRADLHPGATYALFVPTGYTPDKTWPLVIGLHGGGADGKKGDEVVGSGPSAMNFYRGDASQRGYIVACPNAMQASWGQRVNEPFIRDMIEELKLLYHIDTDRIYLTGHSMGGFGTWALAPRFMEDLAAASPMAGGGGSAQSFVDGHVPIFIFHGADDAVVGVGSDRSNAKQLLGSGHDFIYTELPRAGHGFPPSIRRDLFDFFDLRRRYEKRRKSAWPRSSFLGKVSKDEQRYLSDPMAEIDGVVPDLKSWLTRLRLGGGCALSVVGQIAEAKPEGAVQAVSKIVGKATLSFDARAYAARTLGLIGAPEGAAALGRAVALPATKDQSMVAVEAAKALSKLRAEGATRALERAAQAWVTYFQDKIQGEQMRYSDWQRSVSTLNAVVEAWAACADSESNVKRLADLVVDGVFRTTVKVQTSSRVPQDPDTMRNALAKALGHAHQASAASAEAWGTLMDMLQAHPGAHAAAKSQRK